MKTIKAIRTRRFTIELVECDTGEYRVGWETADDMKISEPMKDFNTASLLYDMKLQELEGN